MRARARAKSRAAPRRIARADLARRAASNVSLGDFSSVHSGSNPRAAFVRERKFFPFAPSGMRARGNVHARAERFLESGKKGMLAAMLIAERCDSLAIIILIDRDKRGVAIDARRCHAREINASLFFRNSNPSR